MSPSLELQGAIVAHLKADAGVAALVAGRVFDPVPRDITTGTIADANYPYVAINGVNEEQDDADCIEAVTVTVQVDAVSRARGAREISEIADAVRASLHRAALVLTTNALVEIEHRRTDRIPLPDGLTTQAAMQFAATIEIR